MPIAIAIAVLAPSLPRADEPADFAACVADLRKEMGAKGVAAKTLDAAFESLEADPGVIERMEAQPEFEMPVWEYLARLVDDRRIDGGKVRLETWSPVLDRAEREYGVDRFTIVAVWGVESDYGRILGRRPLVRSLATLSCFGARQRYFRGELAAALQILQAGDMKTDALRGSWAGAFGHTQFMPSTFQRSAVDFDGDGRRDLVESIPDALGSVANYLKRAGWVSGQPWGYEVRLPDKYHGPSGRHARQPLAEWTKLGVARIDGKPLTGEGPAALLLPAGTRGAAFIVFRNFDAIHSYNASESYALAIAHLSDRLRGGGPIQHGWPTDDRILSRTERKALQEKLIERGFLAGEADGIVGSRTVAAVKAFQASMGLPADGYASARVLEALRGTPAAPRASD
ncbi:MAG: lytic murein transglycosylase [Usitatibacter sp.]